jgi:hypothetical protein
VIKLTKVEAKDISRRCSLEGITITELVLDGNSFKSITMQDKKGVILKFSYSGYSVEINALKEPKFEEKWVLKGKYKGLEVKEIFEYESDAMKRKDELDDSNTLVINKDLVEVEE